MYNERVKVGESEKVFFEKMGEVESLKIGEEVVSC